MRKLERIAQLDSEVGQLKEQNLQLVKVNTIQCSDWLYEVKLTSDWLQLEQRHCQATKYSCQTKAKG